MEVNFFIPVNTAFLLWYLKQGIQNLFPGEFVAVRTLIIWIIVMRLSFMYTSWRAKIKHGQKATKEDEYFLHKKYDFE